MSEERGSGREAPILSIVIPVYNERDAVGGVIRSIIEQKLATPCEIVVVDDGSDDGTGAVLEGLADPWMVRLLRHDRNRGYGAALKTGIDNALGELVMIIDSDGSYPPDRFDEFAGLAADYDMVVGARGGGVLEEPWPRTLVKSVILGMLRNMAGIDVPDLNSGLRLMKRDQVRRYFHLLPDGLSFTSTITLILLSEGKAVKYVDIDYFARKGASKFRPFRDTTALLALIARTLMYFNPLQVLMPLALGLFVLALAVGAASTLLGKFMDVTTVVIMLTSVQVFVLGLVADLIAKRRA